MLVEIKINPTQSLRLFLTILAAIMTLERFFGMRIMTTDIQTQLYTAADLADEVNIATLLQNLVRRHQYHR